jgi:hypothetical protein
MIACCVKQPRGVQAPTEYHVQFYNSSESPSLGGALVQIDPTGGTTYNNAGMENTLPRSVVEEGLGPLRRELCGVGRGGADICQCLGCIKVLFFPFFS